MFDSHLLLTRDPFLHRNHRLIYQKTFRIVTELLPLLPLVMLVKVMT